MDRRLNALYIQGMGTANIIKTFHDATSKELDNGLWWYKRVNKTANGLAKSHKLTVKTVASIIAAVSPGLLWDNNVEVADRIMRNKSLAGLGVRWYDGVRKAELIRDGHNPDVILKGNKVRAFATLIADPTNRVHVCVDGHAYNVWMGSHAALDKTPTINDRLYRRISGDYMKVAQSLGIYPHQVQAVTWTVYRRGEGK